VRWIGLCKNGKIDSTVWIFQPFTYCSNYNIPSYFGQNKDLIAGLKLFLHRQNVYLIPIIHAKLYPVANQKFV
jgi:hypothetical protein